MGAPRPLAEVSSDAAAPTDVGLGFLRLAILDLTPTGNGPLVEPGRAALTFNGEIYNYLELREELRGLGWAFRSTGDAEVLLKGWLQWGFDLLPRLNGMWAFGLYDERRRGLLLCRDRFGEKPLFWTDLNGGIAFASEVKELARFPGAQVRVDLGAAARYLASGRPYDGSSSWFTGIHQLEPGSWLWIDESGRTEGRYFDLATAVREVEPSPTAVAWADRFATAFEESVRLRLRSDVPVGTSLSSGVDSSAVMAGITSLGHSSYHSFTLVSDDPRVDEGRQAGDFARTMGSTWHPVEACGDEFAASWDRMTRHHEAPIASTSLYGQWKVLETARAHGVIVMLDGQGADEVLGGYHKFFAAHLRRAVRRGSPGALRLGWQFARQIGGPSTVVRHGYRYLGRLSPGPGLDAALRPEWGTHDTAPSVTVDDLTMRLADIERWSLPNLLTYVDRSAMAHSVETRLPFLDPGLAALALAMPADVLIRNGLTKWPLRRTLYGLGGKAPALRRGKGWFGVPQSAWLRGPLAAQVEEWLVEPHAAWDELVDRAALGAVQHAWRRRRPTEAWDQAIFQAVALDRFLRIWGNR